MASLPDNWESDYDGESERWFYRYKPTGFTQFTFPKPGDEYPEYIDTFSPAPELSPEERLESHYQVKRRNTAGGDSSPPKNKKGNGLTSATMSGPADDDGNFWYQPDGLMYMGPGGGYTDVSPEADEDERLQGFGGPATDPKQQKDANKADVTPPEGSSNFISPAISAENTPMAGLSKPATATPVLEKVSTVYEADATQAQAQAAAAPESPEEVPLLDGRRIYSPVGYMAELPSEQTAQCRHETHPDPVELPTQYHVTQAVAQPSVYAYSEAFHMAAAELPADQSPVTKHAHTTALTTPDQKVLVQPQQTSSQGYAPANPFHVHQAPLHHHYPASLSISHQQHLSAGAAQSPTTQYHPYTPDNPSKPAPAPHDNPYTTAHRQAQENVPPDHLMYSQPVLKDVPAVLRPPQVPPKRPISHHEDEAYIIPGSNSRHESISDPSHQPHPMTNLDQYGSRLVPSVLRPGGGRASPAQPSLPDHHAQSTPDYRPYHPYEDLEKQIDSITRLYSPPPPHDKPPSTRPVLPDTSQSYSGSTGQASMDITPGISRANTLPTDMPALPFIGVDPSRGLSQGQPAAELAHRPRDSVSTIQEDQEAVFRGYSTPTANNPIVPPALRTGQNSPASNHQSSPFHIISAGSQTPDALRKPSLPHQTPSQYGFVSPQGQSYFSQARPASTQQFHTWQQSAIANNPVQDHPPRPLSVQSLQNPSTVRPEAARRPPHPEPKPLPHTIPRGEMRASAGGEKTQTPSSVGLSSGAIPRQQSPAIPDRKYRIQSVDSAATATATAATTTRPAPSNRRVSLSNPSHGFIVESSAMPPPSVQSLRNEGSSRPSSPSPPPGSGLRPGAATARPRPMSMQFPSSNLPSSDVTQPPSGPYKPTIPPPGHGPFAMQPPRSGSPFHQFSQTPGPRGSVSAYAQVAGQGGMRTTASNSPPPQSWQTSNTPPAVQRHQSPSPAQGGIGPVLRPVSGVIQPQVYLRSTGTERSDRLPTPQPVPLPQPTPPTPQQTVSGGPTPPAQARRVPQPVPVPVPQPSPVPRPAPSQNPYPGQAPPRPDKKPGIGALTQATKRTTSPVPSTRVQTPLAVVAALQPSAMSKPQINQSVQPPQPTPNVAQRHAATPSSSQGIPPGPRPIKPPLGQQPQAPPSHGRNTERVGAGSQNYAAAPMSTTGVTAPPHIQQPPRLAQPPNSIVGQASGPPNVGANPKPMPPPSTIPTRHASVVPHPSTNNQQQAVSQQPAGIFHQNQMLSQSLGHYVPKIVPGPNNTQQIVYMTSGGGPQPIYLPHVTTATQGPIVSQGSPLVMTTNQPPQPTSSPVYSPQTTGPGNGKEKDKERWFGKVFKSGSVKKQQNPVTAAAQTTGNDNANKGTGEKATADTAGRNKLQKNQPGSIQPAVQPQPTQLSQQAFAQTTSPVYGTGIPNQAMPFVQGSNVQLAQHSGPYFQPVGGTLYWNNQVPNVQQGGPQQQQQGPLQQPNATPVPPVLQKTPPQAQTQTQPRRQSDSVQQSAVASSQQQQQPLQSTVTMPPVVLQNNPQTQTQPRRESNPSQQYPVASPYQQQQQPQPNISLYQTHAGGGSDGHFYQPQYGIGQHQQSVDQSHGYFHEVPPVGQTDTPAQYITSTNETPRRPSEPSSISAPRGSVSLAGEANPRRPSEPSSISGPRGSISNNTEVDPSHGQGQSQGFGGWGGGNQPQQPQQQLPPPQSIIVIDHDQKQPEQANRDSSSRKSISSSIAPSFANSMTDDSAFTTVPRRGDADADTNAVPRAGDTSADDADPYVSAARTANTNSNTGGSISVSDNTSSTVVVPATSAEVYSNFVTATTTVAAIPTAASTVATLTITPAPAPAPPATTPTPPPTGTNTGTTPSAPQTSSYRLAALRADQLWGSKAKSNGAGTSTGQVVSAMGSPASSVHEEASLASSPEGSPPPPAAATAVSTFASTSAYSAAALIEQTKAAAGGGSGSNASASTSASTAAAAAAAAAKEAERKKWATSEYDGSGWGDEEGDGYGYDYGAGYGYGGGYR